MKSKQAQVALEFLTTYGWAILVVMVAIGALAYFGVLNPSKSLPERAVFGNGLTAQDQQIAKDDSGNSFVRVTLLNNLGKTIYFPTTPLATWKAEGLTGNCAASPASVAADKTISLTCVLTGVSASEKLKVSIDVPFARTSGGLTQVSKGEIYAQVQTGYCDMEEGFDFVHCSDGKTNCGEEGLDCTCNCVCDRCSSGCSTPQCAY